MAKKIIICGAGIAGQGIAKYLVSQGSEVTIIDKDENLLTQVGNSMDVRCVDGNASDPEVLEKCGIVDADIIIAVTSVDAINMLICQTAQHLYNTETKIARVRDQSIFQPNNKGLFMSPKDFGIDVVISPEKEIAKSITRSLKVPGAFSAFSVAEKQFRIIGVKCTDKSAVVNTPIAHINSLFPNLDISVISIIRGTESIIPNESEIMHENDEIYFCVRQEQVDEAVQAFVPQATESGHLLILGGGNIGYFLAHDAHKMIKGISIKIIEKDINRSRNISRSLPPDTIVLCGDVLDEDILIEAGADSAKSVISVTNNDSVNVLSSILAKKMGAHHAQALINHQSYLSIAPSLGVDSLINPQMVTVSKVLRAIRSKNMKSVYSLRYGFAEIFEAEIKDGNTLIGQNISDINIDGKVKIIAILRDKKPIIISGNKDIKIENMDRVIMIVHEDKVHKMEKLLSKTSF